MSQYFMDKIRRAKLETSVIQTKKLVLVLDLDHTLLHSVRYTKIRRREVLNLFGGRCKKANPTLLRGLHRLPNIAMITKLRPGVFEFLKQASEMFELFVYTMGKRIYAQEMVRILDPQSRFLDRNKVIAYEDCTVLGRKNLDVVLADERGVLILDDTEEVWIERCRRNLISMPKYFFFSSGRRWHRPAGEKSAAEKMLDDEDTVHGNRLMAALDLLRSVHRKVFDENCIANIEDVDVRRVLDGLRREGKVDLHHKIDSEMPLLSSLSDEFTNKVEKKKKLVIRLPCSVLRNAVDPSQKTAADNPSAEQAIDSTQQNGKVDSGSSPTSSSDDVVKKTLKIRIRFSGVQKTTANKAAVVPDSLRNHCRVRKRPATYADDDRSDNYRAKKNKKLPSAGAPEICCNNSLHCVIS